MPIPVHVGRSDRHAIETRESFETAGSFTVRVTNHGQDAHVHLRPDDDLARVARVEGDGNYYVEGGDTRRIRVDAAPGEDPVTGQLTVETGYGAESAGIAVTVAPPDTGPDADESLANPEGDEAADGEGSSASGDPIAETTLPEGSPIVAVMAVLALVVAGIAVAIAESPVVIAGVAVVFVGILSAAVLLVR